MSAIVTSRFQHQAAALVSPREAKAATPVWKRALDLLCVCLALPALLPIMLLIATLIKVVSPGPVFFKQERVGFRRQRFLCYKFRTMKAGADTQVHQNHFKNLIQSGVPMTKMDSKGDSRLIPFASVIRAMGLDELPQIINVVLGDMSLVGPRPCTRYEFESYPEVYHARFDTLPGLTGLWQVSGKNKTTFSEMMSLDIHYTRNKTAWMDMSIMMRTFAVLAEQLRESRQASRPSPRWN
jgi:lipopolysaccharide/colanic/teichoic acid biosynthesis glycosyltransferase